MTGYGTAADLRILRAEAKALRTSARAAVDAVVSTQALIAEIQRGMISVNEAREQVGLGPCELPAVLRPGSPGRACSYCLSTVRAGRDRCQVCGAPR